LMKNVLWFLEGYTKNYRRVEGVISQNYAR
jgi:hypothetical protein